MGTSNFNGVGGYRLTVDARLESQNLARKTSTVYWEMVVDRPTDWWAWSTTNMGNRGRVWDQSGTTLWENGNMAFDFRQGNRWIIARGRRIIQHRPDGTGEYTISGDMNLYSVGAAAAYTGWRSLPRLAQVPAATTPIGIDLITTTSMRYRFAGNWDGGTTVREWQVLWQEASGANRGLWSNGTTVLTGLKPDTLYTFSSRGRNDVGWGPWSDSISARTLAGARVLHDGVWRNAVPYVKHQGVWRPAESHIRHGGQWKRGI